MQSSVSYIHASVDCTIYLKDIHLILSQMTRLHQKSQPVHGWFPKINGESLTMKINLLYFYTCDQLCVCSGLYADYLGLGIALAYWDSITIVYCLSLEKILSNMKSYISCKALT